LVAVDTLGLAADNDDEAVVRQEQDTEKALFSALVLVLILVLLVLEDLMMCRAAVMVHLVAGISMCAQLAPVPPAAAVAAAVAATAAIFSFDA
jgi:xanthine/uracil permease